VSDLDREILFDSPAPSAAQTPGETIVSQNPDYGYRNLSGTAGINQQSISIVSRDGMLPDTAHRSKDGLSLPFVTKGEIGRKLRKAKLEVSGSEDSTRNLTG
jgi:hypothetical protein